MLHRLRQLRPVPPSGEILKYDQVLLQGQQRRRRQPINVRAPPPNDAAQNMGLRHVAESTGGLGFFDTNDLRGSIEKAIEDTAVTYTLGFYPSETALDGTMHPLKVKVARKGVEVRYRDSYYALAAERDPPTLEELRMDPLDATAIGLTAIARPNGKPEQSAIDVSVNLRDLRLDHEADRWRGSFDLELYLESQRKTSLRTITLDLSEEEFQSAYTLSTPLPSGAAGQLRIVVRDRTTGAAGSLRMLVK